MFLLRGKGPCSLQVYSHEKAYNRPESGGGVEQEIVWEMSLSKPRNERLCKFEDRVCEKNNCKSKHTYLLHGTTVPELINYGEIYRKPVDIEDEDVSEGVKETFSNHVGNAAGCLLFSTQEAHVL